MGVFAIGAGSSTLSLIWITFILKESVKKKQDDSTDPKLDNKFLEVVKSSFMYVLDGFRTIIKPRDDYRRLFVFLGLFNYCCFISGFLGYEGVLKGN